MYCQQKSLQKYLEWPPMVQVIAFLLYLSNYYVYHVYICPIHMPDICLQPNSTHQRNQDQKLHVPKTKTT